MYKRSIVPVLLVALASMLDSAAAQRPQDFRGKETDRLKAILTKMDANQDGQLTPAEIPPGLDPLIQRAAAKAGIKEGEPIEIRRLVEAQRPTRAPSKPQPEKAAAESKSATPPDGQSSSAANSEQQRPTKADDSRREKEPAADTSTPDTVPGFGEADELAKVPGFGEPAGDDLPPTGAAAKSGANSDSRSDRERSLEKVRRYASSLLKQYDKNKNNVLERDEWKRMRGDPEKADTNKDGVITVEELTGRLASYSRRRSSSSRYSSSSSEDGDDDDPDDDSEGRRSARFLSPIERLPEGLPSWFASRDRNRDGQVAMAEFTSSWTDSKVTEFFGYDSNRDGFITAQECLDSAEGSTTPSRSRFETGRFRSGRGFGPRAP